MAGLLLSQASGPVCWLSSPALPHVACPAKGSNIVRMDAERGGEVKGGGWMLACLPARRQLKPIYVADVFILAASGSAPCVVNYGAPKMGQLCVCVM